MRSSISASSCSAFLGPWRDRQQLHARSYNIWRDHSFSTPLSSLFPSKSHAVPPLASRLPPPLPRPLPLPRPPRPAGRPAPPHKLFLTTPSSPSSPPVGVGDDGREESIESVDSIVSDFGIGSLSLSLSLSLEVWPGRGDGDVWAWRRDIGSMYLHISILVLSPSSNFVSWDVEVKEKDSPSNFFPNLINLIPLFLR